jgi:hypothetical protein
VNFCPHCGAKIQFNESKYCHNCGLPLIVANDVNRPSEIDKTVEQRSQETSAPTSIAVKDVDEPSGINKTIEQNGQERPAPPIEREEIDEQEGIETTAYSKGKKFEDIVESILKAEGYSTTKRQRLDGQKGKSEVDILAVKKYRGKEKKLAVECKNYDKPVPVKEVRDFLSKLEDLEIPNGLFVAYKEFSSDAKTWGEKGGIQLWDGDTVYQKFYELQVGRLKTGEEVRFNYNLPLRIDYAQATHLDLANKEKVEISAKLIWRPFYKVFYEVHCTQHDPIKRKHQIDDEDFNIVNALRETPKEEKETDIFIEELEQTPEEGQSFYQPEDYKLIKLSPHLTQGAAKAETIGYVIEKNTRVIQMPQKRGRRRNELDDVLSIFFDTREWTLKPSPRDVRIRDIQIVYVPKWEIEFQSKDYTYVRVMSGNSGTSLADTITYCSKHRLEDFLGFKKKTVAVCDTCGQALCQEHIFRCPTCSSWLCEKDSIQCSGCKNRFCPDHIKDKCFACAKPVCDACALRCPICGEIHCTAHMTKCSRCGKDVCVSCIRKEGGLLFKKAVCKNCQCDQ